MHNTHGLDYVQIAKHFGDHQLVGFGESTHGTHEFFFTKTEVFKLLVTSYGFNTLFFESIDDAFVDLNKYLVSGVGNPVKLINKLFYVYRTQEILDLLIWLRKNYRTYPVTLVGIDESRYVDEYSDNYGMEMVNKRDKRMALVIKNNLSSNLMSKGMIWAHDAHVASQLHTPEETKDGHIPAGQHLRSWFKDNYFCIAQLFGSGYFNAALIEESGEFDNSLLIPHFARKPSREFWENKLANSLIQPTFLTRPDYGGLIESGEVRYMRALGWGVKRSLIHDNGNVAYVDISKSFDALTFIPKATASQLLK